MEEKIQRFFEENSKLSLIEFHKKLITTSHKIYGIETPKLRKFAKTLAKENFPLNEFGTSHEEILLRGFCLANMKLSDKEIIDEFEKFSNEIDNWATCDMIVSTLKNLKTENGYKYFVNKLKSTDPFQKRIGIVGLMDYFIDRDNTNLLTKINDENYYVKMALAWYLCTLICKDFEKGVSSLKQFTDKFTRNKAISKCHDSFRLNKAQKEFLKTLKI